MSSAPPISAQITPEELAPHALRAIGALKDLPLQQQLAALQAAVAIMKPRTAKHFLLLCILLAIAGTMLPACAGDPPRPFEAGHPTIEPQGCTALRERDGEC